MAFAVIAKLYVKEIAQQIALSQPGALQIVAHPTRADGPVVSPPGSSRPRPTLIDHPVSAG
jgi:hypothetical protein